MRATTSDSGREVREAGGPPIRWERPIPLVTSRYFMLDTYLAITVSIAIMYAAVALMALAVEGDLLILPWQFAAGAFAFFGTLFPLIALVVFQNRFDASFAVSAAGFEVAAGMKARKVNRIVLVLSLLSGRAAAIGPAMLASADQERAIAWGDVRSVRYHPGDHVIELRDSIFRMNRLFCPPEQYAAIEARVRAEIGRAPRRSRAFDWRAARMRLAWNAVAALGWFLAVAWYPEATLAWITGAAVAAALSEWVEWWLGRFLAALGLVCFAVAVIHIATRALESREFAGLFTIHGYDTDTELLWITAAGLGLLAVGGARGAWRRRRG